MRQTDKYGWKVHITKSGYGVLAVDAGVARVELKVRRYLEGDRMRSRYGLAMAAWQHAEDGLWAEVVDVRRIGADIREAMQQFMSALVERADSAQVDPNTASTKNRLRSVIEVRRPELGDTQADLLEAFEPFWSALNEAVQKAPHATQNRGTALTPEDARRFVFAALVIMSELDAVLWR